MVKSVIFITIVFATIVNSFAQNKTGDFDFVVTVLDNFKKPIKNLEVRLKNEEEDLITKKSTLNDGTIEFRALYKNKSYHLEFEKTHEKLKNAEKIYIKDIVKTEEITKAETGFDYFVFVGENVSFSEIGIRDPRPDTPEQAVQNTTSTIASNESKIAENNNSANVVTNNEKGNEVIAETKKQEVPTTAVASNSSESTNKNTSESVSENSKVTNSEKVNEVIAETKKQEVATTAVASNSSQTANNNSSNDLSKNQKSSEINEENNSSTINSKTDESTALVVKSKSTENNTPTVSIDFSLLKDKDFNNPETHELLIKEEEKIKNKKINYKVQIGAYTHQEVADKILVNGFKVEKQTYPDGFTRVTIGNCNSLKEAEQLRKKLISKGMKDSWILGFYESKRFTMKELASNNFFQ